LVGVSLDRKAEHDHVLARRPNVTAEMALRLARYFGMSAQVWQNLQRA
jgi:plasmid maintenance system antidote protein VapI